MGLSFVQYWQQTLQHVLNDYPIPFRGGMDAIGLIERWLPPTSFQQEWNQGKEWTWAKSLYMVFELVQVYSSP